MLTGAEARPSRLSCVTSRLVVPSGRGSVERVQVPDAATVVAPTRDDGPPLTAAARTMIRLLASPLPLITTDDAASNDSLAGSAMTGVVGAGAGSAGGVSGRVGIDGVGVLGAVTVESSTSPSLASSTRGSSTSSVG